MNSQTAAAHLPWSRDLKPALAAALSVATTDLQLSIWFDDVHGVYVRNIPADSPLWDRFDGDKPLGVIHLDSAVMREVLGW